MNTNPETSENLGQAKTSSALERWSLRFAWFFVGVGFFAAAYGLYVVENSGGFSLANLSNFGSYAQGSVASIWSLAGLLFIFVAFLSQKRQLAQQEREFEQQTLQFQLQQQSIQLQSFETSFFQLVQMLGQIVSELKDAKTIREPATAETRQITYEGRNCFAHWYEQLRDDFTDDKSAAPANTAANQLNEAAVKSCCEQFFQSKQASFGHYFRILYHAIKFADSTQLLKTNEEKRRYISMIRAQLSAYEVVLLFYNGICPMSVKFRPLIERYGLLEHLDKGLLLDATHKSFYDRAYK